MSLSIIQTVHAINLNLSIPFGVSGGTGPYAWSVLPDGAGGTINASTGEYTSPSNNTGVDVIQVTDSLAAVAMYNIMVGTPLELVCDIIQTSMGLQNGQVYLWDQKINIPKDSRLYIAVGVMNAKPFGNHTRYVGGSANLMQVQTVNMLVNVSIDILSRSTLALYQKEQVLLALTSTYAENQMELNSFFIAPLSNAFVNLSQIDGAAIPYRFNISANLQYFSSLTQPVDYYDTFAPVQVTVED